MAKTLLQSITEVILRDPGDYNPLPGSITGCCLCSKPFLMRPYSGPPDPICSECFKTYSECAKILCRNCKVVLARVKPEVLDSGYYISPRCVLHSNGCPRCDRRLKNTKPDELGVTTIMEIDEWEARMGRKTIVEVRCGK
jgi:hypothetical protein